MDMFKEAFFKKLYGKGVDTFVDSKPGRSIIKHLIKKKSPSAAKKELAKIVGYGGAGAYIATRPKKKEDD